MFEKLDIELNTTKKEHDYFLLMDEISAESGRPLIEWIFDANFAEKRPEMLTLMICSQGGDLNTSFAIIDTMRGSAIPIRTIGLGHIGSAGLLIFISGTKGERILTPNTSILSHQFSWGTGNQKSHELFAIVKEFSLTEKRMMNHYIKSTGMSEEQVKSLLLPAHDVWLDADEAKNLGLCDLVRDMS
jgi:ATP-dependent Clp protease protease subunit